MKLPRELAPIRDWLEEERPFKDQSLEDLLEADANVLVNPARGLAIQDFQGGIFMLVRGIRAGRVKVKRPVRPKRVAPREFTVDEFPQTT